MVGGEGGIDGDRVEALFEKLPPMLVICRNGAWPSCTAVMPAGLLRRAADQPAPPGRNAIVVGRLSSVVRISFWK